MRIVWKCAIQEILFDMDNAWRIIFDTLQMASRDFSSYRQRNIIEDNIIVIFQ